MAILSEESRGLANEAVARPLSRLIFVLLFFHFSYFLNVKPSWNVNARLDLIFAIVEEHRLTIDSYHEGPQTFTNDKTIYDGHYYSSQAVGPSILGALLFAPIHPLFKGRATSDLYPVARYFLTLLLIGLPAALLGAMLFSWLFRLCGDPWRAIVATICVMLGTLIFPFSTLLFSHILTATLLFGAFLLLFLLKHDPRRMNGWRVFFAGFLVGMAAISEFPSVLVGAILGVYCLQVIWNENWMRRLQHSALLLAGVALPVVLLLVLNVQRFGSLMGLGYSHLALDWMRKVHASGILGVGWPKLDNLFYITFHPLRGLLAQSPALLFSLLGFFALFRQRQWRAEAIVACSCFFSLLLMNAGFSVWWGGWAIGPRYVIPALPFLALPLAFTPKRSRKVLLILGAISLLNMYIATAGDPLAPDHMIAQVKDGVLKLKTLPLVMKPAPYSYSLRNLIDGKWVPNLAGLLGIAYPISLVPLVTALGLALGKCYSMRQRACFAASENK